MTKILLLAPLALTLIASSGQARPRAARLLSDAPTQQLAVPQALQAESANLVPIHRAPAPIGLGVHLLTTWGAGTVGSVAGVLVGAGLGSLSNSLIGAMIPVLLSNLFLPPLIAVLGAVLVGNWDAPGRFGFWLPLAGAFAVNAAVAIITSLMVVMPWTNPVALLLYGLVDGALMSGATVGVMRVAQAEPAPTLKSFVPGVSDTTVVPVAKVSL